MNPLAILPDDNNPLAARPSWADAMDYNAKAYQEWARKKLEEGIRLGLNDPVTGWPTDAGYRDAGNQVAMALLGGTMAPKISPVDHMLSTMAKVGKGKWGIRVVEDLADDLTQPLAPSRKWIDGKPTDKPLRGTSTVGIPKTDRATLESVLKQAGIWKDYNPQFGYYPGEHVYLVRSDKAYKGADPGEWLLPGAKVYSYYKKNSPEFGE